MPWNMFNQEIEGEAVAAHTFFNIPVGKRGEHQSMIIQSFNAYVVFDEICLPSPYILNNKGNL